MLARFFVFEFRVNPIGVSFGSEGVPAGAGIKQEGFPIGAVSGPRGVLVVAGFTGGSGDLRVVVGPIGTGLFAFVLFGVYFVVAETSLFEKFQVFGFFPALVGEGPLVRDGRVVKGIWREVIGGLG